MATSPDGVLSATFDPDRNLVTLLTGGWPEPGVLRTTEVTNPRPSGGTTGWRVSAGETITYLADDGGQPCIEVRDVPGNGGLYVDPNANLTPGLGKWIAAAYDVRALDPGTAAEFRMRPAGYSGTTIEVNGLVGRPLEKPFVNYIANPSFETGISGAVASSDITLSHSAFAYVGSRSLGCTVSATPGGFTYVTQNQVDTAPGEYVAWKGMVRSSGGSYRYRARFLFFDTSNTQIGTSAWLPYVTGPSASWVEVQAATTAAPPNAAKARLYLYVATMTTDSGPAGGVFATDAWIMGKGPTADEADNQVATYFDGATTSTADMKYEWDGPAHGSTSRALRPYQRVSIAAQVTAHDAAGYVRMLMWPGSVVSANNGFRFRRAVVAVADTEAEALAAVASFFDGSTPATGGLEYGWSGTANNSRSTESWVLEVPDRVSLTRSVAGASPVPVRGAQQASAPGGVLLWSDNEAPLDAVVTYTATGYRFGLVMGTATVNLTTEGAEWGAWLKIPGRPEMTVRAKVRAVGDMTRETLGGRWVIPGGPTIAQAGAGALAQSAGMGPLSATLELTTYNPGDLAAVLRTLEQAPAQTVLVQTGQPEELPSGYYQAENWTVNNPTGLRSDLEPMRHIILPLVQAAVPAGPASGWTGTTLQDIYNQFPTLQDIVDADRTLLDLATGAWS